MQPAKNSRLLESLALLADLRKEVEDLLPAVDWTTRCHADSEVLAFMQLAIGNVAAIDTLAKRDVRFVVAGTAAARAAYEEVVTAAWMVWTDDLAERDRRWTSLFVEERGFWRMIVGGAIKRRDSTMYLMGLREQHWKTELIEDLQPKLTLAGAGTVEPLPKFDKRLAQVGQPHYLVYRNACQLIHPATRSLSLVRDLLAAHSNEVLATNYGYRTTERDWTTAVLLGAESLWFGLDTLAKWMRAPSVTPRATALFNTITNKVRTFT